MHWVTLAGLEHVHEVRHQRSTNVFVCVLMLVVMFTAHRSILLTLRSLTQLSLDATSHAHLHSSKQASRRANSQCRQVHSLGAMGVVGFSRVAGAAVDETLSKPHTDTVY